MCPDPREPWRRHVIIEGNSFPSDGADNTKLQFRVRRQKSWLEMTPDEISRDELALNHPTNLYELYGSFSRYVDVRFVVLHRPYLETIASHPDFDASPVTHSSVISGFLLLLKRFLHRHMNDAVTGAPLWTIVCADKLSSRQYETEEQLSEAREHVVGYLSEFLGWPQRSCPRCFDSWRESTKVGSPEERLGEETTRAVMEHVELLGGKWPPRREEDYLPEQQCRM